MNYLAHCALAEPDIDARVGALVGDFMRGISIDDLPPAIADGVRHHRAVDAATDAHPATRSAIAALGPEWRRFGGILLDVWFDHVLIRHWSTLRPMVELSDLTGEVYRALALREPHLPDRLARVRPRMADEDWLGSYGDRRNVERALAGISRRFRRPVRLTEAMPVLIRHDAAIERAFLALFDDLAHLDGLRGGAPPAC